MSATYSRRGGYQFIAQASLAGALAAIDAVNADPEMPLKFFAVMRDPEAIADAYAPLCESILRETSARHIIGCTTSLDRKEVIPSLEKFGGTLWFALPYEGFESSDHVVYTHACQSHHLLPLLNWALPRLGKRVYLTGSNYIWGWEINRLARLRVIRAGGQIVAERNLPLGEQDVGRIIDEIRAIRPDFVLNSLVGASCFAFLRAYRALGNEDPAFAPDRCPVLSCNLNESELPFLVDAAEGLISVGPYFRGRADAPAGPFASSIEMAAHMSVMELARLLALAGPGSENWPVTALLESSPGPISPVTHHTNLPVHIAQVRQGAFEVLHSIAAFPGDPFLSGTFMPPPLPFYMAEP